MRNNNRAVRVIAAAITIIMALAALTGCSAVVNDPVVAKVGDIELTYSNFYNIFQSYAQYGIINTGDAVTLAEGRDMVMQTLIDSAVPVAQAHLEGLTLTEEEAEAAKTKALEAMDSYLAEYMDDEIEDEAARREAAVASFNDAISANGYSYDSVLAELDAQYVDEALGTKVRDALYATVEEPTEEEVKARYEKELEDDKAAYAEDPSAYYTDSQYYSYYGNVKPLQAPEGLYYVKHILIMNDEKYTGEDEGRDYKAIAEEVLAKVNAGEDFDALVKEYGEDPGMESNPDGYIIGKDFDGVYDPPFQEAAAKLEAEGDVSGLVEGASGIHIIKRAGNVSTEPVSYEEVKEDIKTLILNERKSELYTSQLEVWKEGLEIVTYDKRVQYVGVQ